MRRVLAFVVALSLAAPVSAQVRGNVSVHAGPLLPSAPVPALNSLPLSLTLGLAAVLPSMTPSVALNPLSVVPNIPFAPALVFVNAAPLVVRPAKAAIFPASAVAVRAALSVETPALSALYDGSRDLPAASVSSGRDSSVPSALKASAPPSREDFPGIIEDLIAGRRGELLSLFKRYSAAAPNEKKSLDDRIQKIVDEINVLKMPAGKTEREIEVANPDFFAHDFLASPDYPGYRADAESRLLNGEYIPQFIYAGAATRLLQDFEEVLGRKLDPLPYRMYGLDLWAALRQTQALDDAALLRLFQSQKIKEPQEMIARLKAVRIPDGASSLGMGPRQVVAYRTLLEDLARKNGANTRAVLKRQRLVFHINEEIADSVLKDFAKNKFYGFDRAKVVFIIQPIFKGYRLEDASVTRAAESPALPYGHGYAATQLKFHDAFTVGPDGRARPLARPLIDEMIMSDAADRFVVATHRINDATKFTADQVVDLDNLALSLSLLDKGYGVTIDLVGNPNKQKGGNNIRFKGDRRSFLIETSNSKGSVALTALLDGAAQTNAPYNAFRLTSTPAAYKKLLDIGIRYNLRFKNGFFYLESVTGDLTQIPDSNSGAIQKKGELIHDFKQLANLLDALDFVKKQDETLREAPGRRGR